MTKPGSLAANRQVDRQHKWWSPASASHPFSNNLRLCATGLAASGPYPKNRPGPERQKAILILLFVHLRDPIPSRNMSRRLTDSTQFGDPTPLKLQQMNSAARLPTAQCVPFFRVVLSTPPVTLLVH